MPDCSSQRSPPGLLTLVTLLLVIYSEAERYSPRGVWDDALEALAKQNPNIKIARSHAFLEMVTKGTLYGRQTDRITVRFTAILHIFPSCYFYPEIALTRAFFDSFLSPRGSLSSSSPWRGLCSPA
jgi:hypothetical protein